MACFHSLFIHLIVKFIFLAYYYPRNGITTTDGVYVSISNRTVPPAISSNIIRARPNVATDIRLTHKTISRLPAPYTSQCIDSYPADYQDANSFFSYSQSHCLMLCKGSKINSTCKCLIPQTIAPFVSLKSKSTNYSVQIWLS